MVLESLAFYTELCNFVSEVGIKDKPSTQLCLRFSLKHLSSFFDKTDNTDSTNESSNSLHRQ